MSKLAPTVVECPGCGEQKSARLFDSLNGDRVAAQVEALLEGTFEQVTCARCGHVWRPEHRMLFAQFSKRVWLVMHPIADRRDFATLERGVELVLERNFGAAPPLVADGVRGVRPRLVFGQHMLTEAVRMSAVALSPPLVECAKLLTVRRRLAEVTRWGVFELAFECFDERGDLLCGVHALPGGARLDTFVVPSDAVAEARAGQTVLEQQYPELFIRPYVSASRYLYGAAV